MDHPAGSRRGLTYDPGRDAARRFPAWVIRHRALPDGIREVMCPVRRIIVLDSEGSWPAKRCSLAHALAHLDLRHDLIRGQLFDRDLENEANQLAARRLISLDDLADVLSWTQRDVEVAAELNVDLSTLTVRRAHLHPSEVAKLQRTVRWLEETA